MGRPKKKGLDYFSLDTNWDTSMRLLKAKFGLEGVGCIIELYKTIYQEGYLIKWGNDDKLLFSCEHHITIERLDEIIQEAFQREIFDQTMFKVHHILTSRGIQKRWKFIMSSSKRTDTEIESLYDLLSVKQIEGQQFDNFVEPKEKTGINSDFTGVNPEETGKKTEFSAQSKVKESKVNNSKRKQSLKDNPPTIEELTEYAKSKYPSVDPNHFLDYYTNLDWHTTEGNPVVNWKNKMLTWHNKNVKSGWLPPVQPKKEYRPSDDPVYAEWLKLQEQREAQE